MHPYLRPDTIRKGEQRQVEKLDACLQALNNIRKALATVEQCQEIVFAMDDVGSAFNRIAQVRKWKQDHLPAVATVNVEVEGIG